MIRLGEADSGTESIVPVGDIIEARLSETPTTGYRWTLSLSPLDILVPEGDAFEALSSRPGAGGWRTLSFRAVRRGTVILRASLRRSWAASREASEVPFTVHVIERP